jgi:adenosylhomocysteine nucleosidase
MESHAVAAIARDAGVPFLVLRALADPFDQTVPQVAREALRPDGRIRIRATYGGLLRQPGQLIALFSLAWQSALALGALRRGARLAGAGLGFTPFPE